jgi:hypothetical protein|eukprot:SAG25_NODE_2588_length_1512_cov_1.445152_2_plen_93_part_00
MSELVSCGPGAPSSAAACMRGRREPPLSRASGATVALSRDSGADSATAGCAAAADSVGKGCMWAHRLASRLFTLLGPTQLPAIIPQPGREQF